MGVNILCDHITLPKSNWSRADLTLGPSPDVGPGNSTTQFPDPRPSAVARSPCTVLDSPVATPKDTPGFRPDSPGAAFADPSTAPGTAPSRETGLLAGRGNRAPPHPG